MGNINKIPEMPDCDGGYQADQPRGKFLTFVLKISAKKHSIEKHILQILVIYLQSFVQDCLRRHIFISNSAQTPWIYNFSRLQYFKRPICSWNYTSVSFIEYVRNISYLLICTPTVSFSEKFCVRPKRMTSLVMSKNLVLNAVSMAVQRLFPLGLSELKKKWKGVPL